MVKILDTTLREGEQTAGVSFTINEKMTLAKMLDDFGVDMIEVGHPNVSPKIEEFIRKVVKENLKAEVVGHVRAVKGDVEMAVDCEVDRVAIFLATSNVHLKDKLKMTKEVAIEKVVDCVQYAKDHGLKVRYTPEDATRTDFDYLIEICNAAIDAGADRISVADTVGVMQPHIFYDLVKTIKTNLKPVGIDVHCHNDFGLAVANAMAGVRAGADCVHTTVNGIGERTGIVDLSNFVVATHILDNENLKYDLKMLKQISAYVEKITGIYVYPLMPIMGDNAFTHKSGVHTDGVLKNPSTYEPFSPEMVGKERKIIVDKFAGRRAVMSKLNQYGIEASDEDLLKIIHEIKKVGDERKIVHETDILDIAEKVLGVKAVTIPTGVDAVLFLRLEAHIYTTSISRKIKNMKGVEKLYEMSGDEDISIYASLKNVAELNNLIEDIRSIPGVLATSTRVVLKKYGEVNGNSC